MRHEERRGVVVVTGASAGVGRSTALAFAKDGYDVGLLARGIEALRDTAAEVEALGALTRIVKTDVGDAHQVEKAAVEIEEALGPIDVWVNNAMASVFSPFLEMTPEEFRRVTDVTYLGYVHGTRAALKRMTPRNRGVVVQVGSALAYRGIPLQSAYCGAKHAIQGFSESVACELRHAHSRVKITMVQMPALNTPQFRWVKSRLPRKPQPVPPIFQPEVAANAVLWAAHHPRREYNVGFSTSAAIVGNNFFPGLGDWYLGKTGFDAQQTREPEDLNRRHNLWDPVPEKASAHGDFDHRARNRSPQFWMSTHRAGLLLVGAALLAGSRLAASYRRK